MRTPEEELKQLLLGAELNLLETQRDRVDYLSERVGDDRALQGSVERILIDALREAGVKHHDRLASVLAPLILDSLRQEIKNSRDLMVDALYPITGRLVTAAVRNAIQTALQNVDQRMNEALSFERWMLRVRARLTRQSEAELLLRENPPFQVEDILLLHRPTGLLLTQVGADDDQDDESGMDSDLVGGMLTAIMSFVRDAIQGDGSGELSTIDFGSGQLYLKTSPAVILAVKADGTPSAAFREELDNLFVAFLERWGNVLRDFDGSLDEFEERNITEDLALQRQRLIDAGRRRERASPIKAYAAVAIVALIAIYFPLSSYLDWRAHEAIQEPARAIMAEIPALRGYPLRLESDIDEDTLRVEGLGPDLDTLGVLGVRLREALPDVTVEMQAQSLPDPPTRPAVERRVVAAVAEVPTLRPYPFAVKLDPSGATLRVSGLVPAPEAVAALRGAVGEATSGEALEVTYDVEIVSGYRPEPETRALDAVGRIPTLRPYPFRASLDQDRNVLTVSGLVPSPEVLPSLRATVNEAVGTGVTVAFQVDVVPGYRPAVETRVLSALRGTPDLKSYPFEARFDPPTNALTLTGLVPSPEAQARVREVALAALDGATLLLQLDIVPGAGSPLQSRILEALEAKDELRGFPLTVRIDQTAKRVAVQGFVPNPDALPILEQTVAEAAEGMAVDLRVDVAPGYRDPVEYKAMAVLQSQQALQGYPFQANFDRGTKRLTVTGIVPSAATLAQASTRLRRTFPDLNLDIRIKELPFPVVPGPSPEEQLRAWVRRNIVRFSSGSTFANEADANARLAELADLLDETGPDIKVRVAGYVNPEGFDLFKGNLSLAWERAVAVRQRLVRLGVSENRIIVAARPYEDMLRTERGGGAVNNRVQFEIAYRQE